MNTTEGLLPQYTIVESFKTKQTLLTEIHVSCNDVTSARYHQYQSIGLEWMFRAVLAEGLFDFGSHDNYRLILEDQFPRTLTRTVVDKKTGGGHLSIVCRRLGEDNGKDQLVNISNYLKGIREFVRSVSRKLTPEETLRLATILNRPPPKRSAKKKRKKPVADTALGERCHWPLWKRDGQHGDVQLPGPDAETGALVCSTAQPQIWHLTQENGIH
jgi:hypothetical protein